MAEIPIQRKTGVGIWPWLLGLLLLLILLWFFFWRNHGNPTTAATTADSSMTVSSTTPATTAPVGVTGATGAMSDTAPGVAAGAAGASMGSAAGNAMGNAAGSATGSAAGGMNPSGASGAVGDFVRFVAVIDPNTDEGKQHAYAAGGLRRLADALASLGASGAPVANIRKQADGLQHSSPTSTRHADMARSGFASAAEAFNSLKGKYPSLDVARVRTAADAMATGAHLLEQKAKIQTFFETASTALQGMTGATAH